ncbi:MAG: ATP-dependent Clp protease adapter ClpS [Betaproteobacteria bacterium]|nr:ATP-dependent Clp protease adapter ClpS [Betaproteobacteria bacterium]NBT74830.1 ATP-dependent Clp protease adapter ClpS [Betaproteobacteria bacterium]NBY13611.1 ATP-dependent Clp protease adapter ClpS [Betaproteobacteria bacterium]NCA16316.1 ATP-dependent Clp protease adapter ClpS [Betaproteobacteria bacterium]
MPASHIRLSSPQNPLGPSDSDTPVIERTAERLAPPPRFTVWLLNDDFTPMEFVVIVLQKFFSMSREQATQVMLKVHREGRGICGVYPKELAETKVEQVNGFSREHQHPLQCVMEEE